MVFLEKEARELKQQQEKAGIDLTFFKRGREFFGYCVDRIFLFYE